MYLKVCVYQQNVVLNLLSFFGCPIININKNFLISLSDYIFLVVHSLSLARALSCFLSFAFQIESLISKIEIIDSFVKIE